LTQAVSKLTTALVMVALARLLVPSDFGLFAAGLLMINYLDRVKDLGIGAGLIYRREEWSRLASTGLPISLVSAGVLAGLAYLSAPLAASVFHEPAVADLVRVLSVALFISGLAVVPESKLRRELDFRRRLLPEGVAAIVKGGVAIGLAMDGAGFWALVWGQLAGTAVQSLLYWRLAGWRPTWGWNPDDARALLRYGLPSALVGILAVLHENLDYIIVGHRLDAEQLGYYVMGFRIPELVVIGICIVTGQVLFPAFSRLQDSPRELAAGYLSAVRYISLATLTAAAVIAVLADEIVLALLGAEWEATIPVLRLLALFSAVYSLSFHAGEIYKATGRPMLLNWIALVKLAVFAPALWWAAGHSIVAVAWAVLLVNVGLTAMKLAIVVRLLRISYFDVLRAFRAAVLAATVVAAVVTAAGVPLSPLPPGWRLVLLSAVALATIGVAVRVLVPEIAQAVAARLRRRTAAPMPAARGRR